MFIDRAKIKVIAGNGGSGMSSFRREKFVPRGGPSGGDGGRGGNVVICADKDQNTLIDFRYKRIFKASHGMPGQTSNKFGKNAEDLIIKVPVGTIIKDCLTNHILADLDDVDAQFIIAKGGRGGRGNARFVTSVHRAPTFAEKGEPGEECEIAMELKLIADVGLIGYPSVGKSSIIAAVSSAKPEIAEYHFTTTVPVLGVVSLGENRSFVLADIPGLIENAHIGKGLGHEFLRHIERTRILVHVIDAAAVDGRDPLEDFHKINKELNLYSSLLSQKPQIVVANKMDLPEAKENFIKMQSWFKKENIEFLAISAINKKGLEELLLSIEKLLKITPKTNICFEEDYKEITSEKAFFIERGADAVFVIKGKEIEKIVSMMDFNNDEAVRRFQLIWSKLAIEEELLKMGIKDGDLVKILDVEFEFAKTLNK